MKTPPMGTLTSLTALVLLLACGDEPADLPSAPAAPAYQVAGEAPQYSDWSAPVNLGPVINTAIVEADPFISRDGLSLYFVAGRGRGGAGGRDIWVAQRASVSDPWGAPQNLGASVNSAGHEDTPTLSADGHRLYFASDRPDGQGGFDLYVSRRHDARDDFGWEAPVNLGSAVNSPANDMALAFFEADGDDATTVYFASNRPGGAGGSDIYATTLRDDAFGPVAPVAELNTPFDERQPAVRRDGLELFLGSDRPGTLGAQDIWVATRASTSDPWSAPVHLGAVINSPTNPPGVEQANDWRPALSFDGTTLYWAAALRPGNVSIFFDLWMSRRSRIGGRD